MSDRVHWSDFVADDLLTETEAASLLRMSVHTLRSWRAADPPRGPIVRRLGATVRYRLADLRAFVDRAATDTVDDPRSPRAAFVQMRRRAG